MIEIYCDNNVALQKRDVWWKSYSKLTDSDVDFIPEFDHTVHLIKDKGVMVHFLEVQGHLDDEVVFVYFEAVQEIRRNIKVDKITKKCLATKGGQYIVHRNPFLPYQRAVSVIDELVVVGNLDEFIQEKYHSQYRLLKLIEEGLEEDEMPFVEWEALQTVMQRADINKRVEYMKIINKQLPTHSRLTRMKFIGSTRCLQCECKQEDFYHVLACQNPGAIQEKKWL